MRGPQYDIEQRLRRLEDREAIRTLVARYALAMDNKDIDVVREIFAPDARFGWIDGSWLGEGRDSIVSMYQDRLGAMGPTFHYTHDQVVDWDEANVDAAAGLVLAHAEILSGGQQYLIAIRYHDRYLRTDGRWRFAERLLGFLYYTPVGDYPVILGKTDRIRLPGLTRPGHWGANRDKT